MIFSCSKNDKLYDSSLLDGDWGMYAMRAEGGEWNDKKPFDPRLQLSFFKVDSVMYFGSKSTYKANEEAGLLTFYTDYIEFIDTAKHEVLRLDETELWLKYFPLDNNDPIAEMKFNRLETSTGGK
jgi:hypothetical protein